MIMAKPFFYGGNERTIKESVKLCKSMIEGIIHVYTIKNVKSNWTYRDTIGNETFIYNQRTNELLGTVVEV